MSNAQNNVPASASVNTQIVGTGRNGDFVHANQEMASNDGFKNVSKIWFDKTISIDDGINALENARSQRHDIKATRGAVDIVGQNDGVAIVIDGKEFKPTEHALLQLCNWYGRTPHTFIKYMADAPTNSKNKEVGKRDFRDYCLVADVIKRGADFEDAKESLIFRTYEDNTLRAVLSTKYLAIDNVWYLEILKNLLPEGRLSHYSSDGDTIYGNVLIPDTIRFDTDSDYGGMVSISNCEIGKRRFIQTPSLFRAICMNGCIWDQAMGSSLNKVHRGKSIDLNDLSNKIMLNINEQIRLTDEVIKRFLKTKDMIIPATVKVENVIAAICEKHKVGTGVASQKNEGQLIVEAFNNFEANDKNLFGVINAITRAGQKLNNKARWYDFDIMGGELFNYSQNQWDNIVSKARNMTDDEVIAQIAIAV